MRKCCVFGIFVLELSVAWTSALAAQAPSQSAPERGKALYEARCAVCHGVDGRADTPVGRLLKPPPRNFADPVEMARVTVDRIYQAIKEALIRSYLPDGRAPTREEFERLVELQIDLFRRVSAPANEAVR